jgi:hypothetical protein
MGGLETVKVYLISSRISWVRQTNERCWNCEVILIISSWISWSLDLVWWSQCCTCTVLCYVPCNVDVLQDLSTFPWCSTFWVSAIVLPLCGFRVHDVGVLTIGVWLPWQMTLYVCHTLECAWWFNDVWPCLASECSRCVSMKYDVHVSCVLEEPAAFWCVEPCVHTSKQYVRCFVMQDLGKKSAVYTPRVMSNFTVSHACYDA